MPHLVPSLFTSRKRVSWLRVSRPYQHTPPLGGRRMDQDSLGRYARLPFSTLVEDLLKPMIASTNMMIA